MKPLLENFIGRSWLADRLLQVLESDDVIKFKERAPFVVIFGGAGVGKSSFVAQVTHGSEGGSWKTLRDRVLAFHYCSYNKKATLNEKICAEALRIVVATLELQQLDPKSDDIQETMNEDGPLSVLREHVFPALESATNRTRDTIWIDSLDEARTTDRQNDSIVQLLQMTKDEWPSWLRIVASSREDNEVRKELKPLDHASIHVKDEENRNSISRFL